MKKLTVFCFFLLAVAVSARAIGLPDDPDGAALLQEAQRAVAAFHVGQPAATNRLRVVYFVPKNSPPLTNYAERIDRVLTDVSDYYRDGFRRFGLTSEGLPLERQDGKLLIHVVHGNYPASHYSYDSGDETAAEIHEALRGEFDTEREHLLVFYALCRQTNGGRYVFSAPYYGGGSQRNGWCHAADGDLLDPLFLHETKKKIVYTEHYYPRMEQTLAQFNTFYLGGVAHELGHCLSLPHDAGSPAEQAFGISLMGGGNVNYRQEVWDGGPPTYLSRASVLKLLSQPLFTGSNRGRWDGVKPLCDALTFSSSNGVVQITGAITDAIPAYGVVAYVWGEKEDDHWSRTFAGVVRDGRFSLSLEGIRTNRWRHFHLVLSTLHANGAATRETFPLAYTASGPDVAALNTEWLVDRAERAVMAAQPEAREFVSDTVIAAAPTADGARKLRALRAVLEPAALVDLRTVATNRVFLSDAEWLDAKVGWGQVARNHFWFDPQIQIAVLLRLGGKFYDKGLYAHASSRYVFALDGKWQTFTAVVGLQDGAASQGSAIFTVRGDGRELYRSKLLRVGKTTEVKVDVSNVKKLELLAEGGEGHNHNCWSVWADPVVTTGQ